MTATTHLDYRDLMSAMAVDLPEGERDGLRVERFTIEPNDLGLFVMSLKEPGARPRLGTYTRLTKNGRLWMSDTTAERRDHLPVLQQAQYLGARRAIINGLGLGMVVKGLLALPTIEHIDVVEIDPRVVRLVGGHYAGDPRVSVHEADAYEQVKAWPRGTRWDVGWSDIWPDLSADALPDMARLNRTYGRRCDWHRCWGQELIKSHVRRYGW
jgi:hypothetical protein